MWRRRHNWQPLELALLAHVWLVATAIPLLVKVLSLKALLALLTPENRCRPYRRVSIRRIRSMVRHRLRKPRRMGGRACLRHGLMVFHFLRLAGVPAALEFAAYAPPKGAGAMLAHCWVTVGGQPVTRGPHRPAAKVLTYTGTHSRPAQGDAA